MDRFVKYLLIGLGIWPAFMCGSSPQENASEVTVTHSGFGDRVWDKTFGYTDKHLKKLHTKIVKSCVVKKMSDYTASSRRVVRHYRVYEDIAGGICCVALAYKNRHAIAPYMSWRNVAYGTGILYLINRLFPDWLKDRVSKIPFLGKFIDHHRLRRCEVTRRAFDGSREKIYPEKSSSFAIAEYALGAGIIYSARSYLSCDTIAKTSLVFYLLKFISPKCKVIKMPILRRLLV